jgi:hypothetical protein
LGEAIVAVFGLSGLLAAAMLAFGIWRERRWARHVGGACLLSLAAAWVLGPMALLAGLLVGVVAWYLWPASNRQDP